MISSLVFFVFLVPVFGGVILPGESVIRGGLTVSEPYRNYDRKLGISDPYSSPYYHAKFGGKPPLFDHRGYPSYQISTVEHDINRQLVDLERNLVAARPYLAMNPQILQETEEQLRALQHIHAGRLLKGIESIRELELQQEVLIHKVNSQLENSVNQLKQMAVLQEEISHKQKSVPVRVETDLPESTIEASGHLTAQLHAIEAAKAQEAVAHEIVQDSIDHAIAQEVVGHAIAKEMADRSYGKTSPRRSGVSSDEGVLRDSTLLDSRSSTTTEHSDSQGENDDQEEEKKLIFES